MSNLAQVDLSLDAAMMDATNADDASNQFIRWRAIPPRAERGTYEIIALCVSTLIICAWNAVHVDVPRRRTFWGTRGAQAAWFLIGLFMPEILLSYALGQYLSARRITAFAREYLGGRKHKWTMTHSFYTLMGGFPELNPYLFVTTLRGSHATDVSSNEIKERSKAGPLAKLILCAQILFFCTNTAARIGENLPLSLLEITTLAHSVCALCAYLVWWHKPQDIGGEAPLRPAIRDPHHLFVLVYQNYEPSSIIGSTMLISALYGCPHLFGLHVNFVTPLERTLWLVSTVLVIACPIIWVTVAYTFNNVKHGPYNTLSFLLVYVLVIVYMPASAFLMGESIRQVFALPERAFVQTQWMQYLPHFS